MAERKINLSDEIVAEEYSVLSDGTTEIFGIAFYEDANPDEGWAEFFDDEAERNTRFEKNYRS